MSELERTAKLLISEAATVVASGEPYFETCNMVSCKALLSVGNETHKPGFIFVTLMFFKDDLQAEWQRIENFAKQKAKGGKISIENKASQWRFTFKVS